MLLDQAERLTRRFYEWERRGRGWASWPYRVALEPPFLPFVHAPLSGALDDGKRHTWLSAITERLVGEGGANGAAVHEDEAEFEDPLPEPDDIECSLTELVLLLPEDQKVPEAVAVNWLRSLSATTRRFAFELVAEAGQVAVQLVCEEPDVAHAASLFSAYLPTARIVAPPEGLSLTERWQRLDGRVATLEFGLSREFMLPLSAAEKWNPDPLTPLIGSLVDTRQGELALVQVLFEATRDPWEESVRRAVLAPDGTPFFADAPELTKLAEAKVASDLFAATIRLLALSPHEGRPWQLVRSMASGLAPLGSSVGNELIPLASDDETTLQADILERATHRSGMLLSAAELVALVHPPSDSVRVPGLVRLVEPEETEPVRELPATASEGETLLGEYRDGGEPCQVRLGLSARQRHMHVIGASGTGKSTFLVNLILQDIEQGHGVGVLDPHGDLVDEVLARLPEERAEDVVLFDPADPEWVVGWNVLAAHSEAERNILSSDLVAAFKRLSSAWGDQMTAVLGNAVLVFLERPGDGTLLDLRNFLIDERYRNLVLREVADEYLASYWRHEFPLLVGKKPQGPILTRLNTFLRSRLIREAVTEEKRGLDFRSLIDSRRIFLARLSQGAIGEENAALLGSLLVSKIHQVTLTRQDQAAEARAPFFLYLDELHEMATPSMASLFSGVRKYRLGVTVAHQDLYQLHAAVPEVERALLDNAFVRVCFRLGDDDARKLAQGFAHFSLDDLANLGTGEALCRVGRKEDDFRLHVPELPAVEQVEARERREARGRASKDRWGRRRVREEPVVRPSPELEEQAPAAAGVEPPAETPPPIATVPPSIGPHPTTIAPPTSPTPGEPASTVSTPPSQAPARARPPREEMVPGRGGPEHKYLQELLRGWGQDRGFKATVELALPDGGWVDVALERDDRRIACEISVTTKLGHEVGNARKCLAAGFHHVALVSLKKPFLKRLKAALDERLDPTERERVGLYTPEDFNAFLAEEPPPATEGTVAGYKVKVKYKRPDDAAVRKKAIANVILKGLNKLKGKE